VKQISASMRDPPLNVPELTLKECFHILQDGQRPRVARRYNSVQWAVPAGLQSAPMAVLGLLMRLSNENLGPTTCAMYCKLNRLRWSFYSAPRWAELWSFYSAPRWAELWSYAAWNRLSAACLLRPRTVMRSRNSENDRPRLPEEPCWTLT